MKKFYNMYYYNVNYIALLIIQMIKLFEFFNNKNFVTINVEKFN